MRLPEFAVKKPITITMLFLGVFLLGAVSIFFLSIDLLPKIDPPAISIITTYPGASATDVENDVTKILEDKLSSVNNLDKLISVSRDNISTVTCKFNWGTNLDVAANDIRDKIDLAMKELPKDIDRPMIFKFNSAMAPVLILSVNAKESYPQLARLAKDVIADNLKKVPGVGTVVIEGERDRQINVFFDPQKLATYHLTTLQVIEAIKKQNIDLPLGSIKTGISEYMLRIPARFKSAKELAEMPVTVFNNRVIFLKDIAKVEDGMEEEIGYGMSLGKPSLVMYVQKQSGANTVDVVDRAEKKLNEIRQMLPADVQITEIINTRDSIVKMIDNLKQSLFLGGLIVILITYLFLRSFRTSLIVSLTIPFSLIIGFIGMYLLGYTINVISLMSLIIAIGMVVDNAIVVTENITKKLEKGEQFRKKAAISGASEMGLAITASTLTTVVVFLPMIFATGITKIIFGQLAVLVTITLLGSLFTALTLAPMLASKWMSAKGKFSHSKLFTKTENIYQSIENFYKKLLGKAVDNPKKTITLMFGIFFLLIFLVPLIGTEFLPESDNGEINIEIRMNERVRLEEGKRMVKKVAELYDKLVPEKRTYYAFVGRTKKGVGNVLGYEEGNYIIQSGAKLVDKEKRKRSAKEVANALRKELEKIPGIEKLSVSAMSAYQKIFFSGGGKPISLEIYGDNLSKLREIGNKVKKEFEKIPGVVDVTVSLEKPRQEVWVKIDRVKLAKAGLTPADIAFIFRTSFYGNAASKFRDGSKDFDIFVRLQDKYRTSMEDLEKIKIPLKNGKTISLSDLVKFEPNLGPVKIERIDRERVVKVEAGTFGITLGEATKKIKEALKKIPFPPGYHYKFGGDIEEQRKAFKTLTLLLILGILLVYMVMASQFESLRQPFYIMFSVPFAFTGVIAAFILTNTPLSLISFIGVVMLMGIVVNNAIVLVDYVNLLRARGLELKEAIKEAGKSRLRPVLMTTLTTIGGTIPMALSRGEGSEMWNELGITLIGGLSVSTLITLIIVPTIYYLFERRKEVRNG